ncbi:MAG: L-histidine N(alpha)-methyltransferase [Anaerolineales bacterium]|nr:L-histidine N(alpha)-methyltransferase [Anaerolineales bacterium]
MTKNQIIAIDPPVDTNNTLFQILHGLQKDQKELPTKLFYDERGSKLFERICKLHEYYPTRTETAIMQQNVHEVVDLVGNGSMLIEYGSGSSSKVRILLDHLPEVAAYVPVDISREQLYRAANELKGDYTELEIIPVWADYNSLFKLPPIGKKVFHKLAYFPGSTIGNFYPNQAIDFLQNIADVVGPGGGLLIGTDLQKNAEVLNRAYNDHAGVTAAFNLNMLIHINAEFGADFNVDQFKHFAFYNEELGRIEMHLISQVNQTAHIAGEVFDFKEGESILTEVSYKYTLDGFAEMAAEAGFVVIEAWVDPKNYFSVQYLIAR